jgi:hypothetical protein
MQEYQRGIECGVLREEWVREIDAARQEVFEKLETRAYPFDGTWSGWRPDPNWSLPALPQNWDSV